VPRAGAHDVSDIFMFVIDSGRSFASPQYTLSRSSPSTTLRFLDDASPVEPSMLFKVASPASPFSFSPFDGKAAKPKTALAVGRGRIGAIESEELRACREDRAVEEGESTGGVDSFTIATDEVAGSTSSASPRFRLPIG
jgi:hypothetical protein